jgi:signal transduction histidine kinase
MKIVAYISGLGFLFLVLSLGFLVQAGWTASSAFSIDTFVEKITDLIKTQSPDSSVNTFSQTEENQKELLPAASYLPQTWLYSPTELRSLVSFIDTCDLRQKFESVEPRMKKALLLTEIICGHTPAPPEFFNRPPYIHPLGRSFVARAYQTGLQAFDYPWLKNHRQFLHVLEYRQLFPNDQTPLFGPSTFLNPSQNRAWVVNSPLIVVDENLWVLKASVEGHLSANTKYEVYELKNINQRLETKGIKVVENSPVQDCLISGPAFCVLADMFYARGRIVALRILWVSTIIISFGFVIFFSHWTQSRTKVRRERTMILQTLAHDLRTPATSIGLSLEQLRNDFERLSGDGQSAYLRIADDVRRLMRLIEGSKSYLNSDSTQRFAKERIDLGAFLQKLIEPYGDAVVFLAPTDPIFAVSHPYWLGICISNLIENACKHGRLPCQISVSSISDGLHLNIKDAGILRKKDYLKLRKEFVKGFASSGMGIGLSIVSSTLKKLGHSLEFFEAPTRFQITIRNI